MGKQVFTPPKLRKQAQKLGNDLVNSQNGQKLGNGMDIDENLAVPLDNVSAKSTSSQLPSASIPLKRPHSALSPRKKLDLIAAEEKRLKELVASSRKKLQDKKFKEMESTPPDDPHYSAKKKEYRRMARVQFLVDNYVDQLIEPIYKGEELKSIEEYSKHIGTTLRINPDIHRHAILDATDLLQLILPAIRARRLGGTDSCDMSTITPETLLGGTDDACAGDNAACGEIKREANFDECAFDNTASSSFSQTITNSLPSLFSNLLHRRKRSDEDYFLKNPLKRSATPQFERTNATVMEKAYNKLSAHLLHPIPLTAADQIQIEIAEDERTLDYRGLPFKIPPTQYLWKLNAHYELEPADRPPAAKVEAGDTPLVFSTLSFPVGRAAGGMADKASESLPPSSTPSFTLPKFSKYFGYLPQALQRGLKSLPALLRASITPITPRIPFNPLPADFNHTLLVGVTLMKTNPIRNFTLWADAEPAPRPASVPTNPLLPETRIALYRLNDLFIASKASVWLMHQATIREMMTEDLLFPNYIFIGLLDEDGDQVYGWRNNIEEFKSLYLDHSASAITETQLEAFARDRLLDTGVRTAYQTNSFIARKFNGTERTVMFILSPHLCILNPTRIPTLVLNPGINTIEPTYFSLPYLFGKENDPAFRESEKKYADSQLHLQKGGAKVKSDAHAAFGKNKEYYGEYENVNYMLEARRKRGMENLSGIFDDGSDWSASFMAFCKRILGDDYDKIESNGNFFNHANVEFPTNLSNLLSYLSLSSLYHLQGYETLKILGIISDIQERLLVRAQNAIHWNVILQEIGVPLEEIEGPQRFTIAYQIKSDLKLKNTIPGSKSPKDHSADDTIHSKLQRALMAGTPEARHFHSHHNSQSGNQFNTRMSAYGFLAEYKSNSKVQIPLGDVNGQYQYLGKLETDDCSDWQPKKCFQPFLTFLEDSKIQVEVDGERLHSPEVLVVLNNWIIATDSSIKEAKEKKKRLLTKAAQLKQPELLIEGAQATTRRPRDIEFYDDKLKQLATFLNQFKNARWS